MKKLNTKYFKSNLITFVSLLALACVCAVSVTAKVNPTFTPINFPGAAFTRADDPSFVFSPIDFPGASFTQALGINPGGDVVGLYRDATGKQHGFLLSGEIFTSIDFPGAAAQEDSSDHRCGVHTLRGSYLFATHGWNIVGGVAVPKAIVEGIDFNGDGTLVSPFATVSINGTIIRSSGSVGSYTVEPN